MATVPQHLGVSKPISLAGPTEADWARTTALEEVSLLPTDAASHVPQRVSMGMIAPGFLHPRFGNSVETSVNKVLSDIPVILEMVLWELIFFL